MRRPVAIVCSLLAVASCQTKKRAAPEFQGKTVLARSEVGVGSGHSSAAEGMDRRERRRFDPGVCAHKLVFTFPSEWKTSYLEGDCATYQVRVPNEKAEMFFQSCVGPVPKRAWRWDVVTDLGDSVTSCKVRRRDRVRLEELTCEVRFRDGAWTPRAEINARNVSLGVAERALEIARTAKTPVSCFPESHMGCIPCDARVEGMEERARALSGDPFSKHHATDLGEKIDVGMEGLEIPAPPPNPTIPFEPWCHYELVGSRSASLRLERDSEHDSADCEAYQIMRGLERVARARACPDRERPTPEFERAGEIRTYSWQLPQGRFTLDLAFREGDLWRVYARLNPWDDLVFPQTVDFESVGPLGGAHLRELVAFASAIRLRPSTCEATKTALCARCAKIMGTRKQVERNGILGAPLSR